MIAGTTDFRRDQSPEHHASGDWNSRASGDWNSRASGDWNSRASGDWNSRASGALSRTMAVFFTSDTHFGHAGALSRFRRPFASVAEMDEAMVANWNATVGPDDEIWHLGDFALRMGPESMASLLDRLNGTKHLITGNNDGPATLRLPGWASVQAYTEMVLHETRLVMCHYAFRTWNAMYKGALNLHGHSHGQLKGMPRQFDVGVDVWKFRPVTLPEIIASRQRKKRDQDLAL